MKPKHTIEKRLRTLRLRYLKQYISVSQERLHQNCVYNYVHEPRGQYRNTKSVDVEIASRKNVTLVVLQPEPGSIRICMYGADDPVNWTGDVCDTDDVSRGCKLFRPVSSAQQAVQEFELKLQDDEYVYEHYRDLATLQWVLETRLHRSPMSWWERFLVWLHLRQVRIPDQVENVIPESVPDNLWDDNEVNTVTDTR